MQNTRTNVSITFGLILVIGFFAVSGFISYWNTRVLTANSSMVTHTHEVITSIDSVTTLMKDAETAQRGFIITGDEAYLQPYLSAITAVGTRLQSLEALIDDNPGQQTRIPVVRSYIDLKFGELAESIEVRRTVGFEAARKIVATDRGKNAMDNLRKELSEIKEVEQELRALRLAEMKEA